MRRGSLLAAVILVVLALMPWGDFQGHTHWRNVGWIPFASPPVRIRDITVNVLLFMPLGATAAVNFRSRIISKSALLAFVLSFAGESAQLYSHTRFPSSTDVVTNLIGAIAGAYLARQMCFTSNAMRRAI